MSFTVPFANHRKLWFYSDLNGSCVWAGSMSEARKLTGKPWLLRVCHADFETPAHYYKPNGHLACDAIEKMPTMKDLINEL